MQEPVGKHLGKRNSAISGLQSETLLDEGKFDRTLTNIFMRCDSTKFVQTTEVVNSFLGLIKCPTSTAAIGQPCELALENRDNRRGVTENFWDLLEWQTNGKILNSECLCPRSTRDLFMDDCGDHLKDTANALLNNYPLSSKFPGLMG